MVLGLDGTACGEAVVRGDEVSEARWGDEDASQSPDCQVFAVSTSSHHGKADVEPETSTAVCCWSIVLAALESHDTSSVAMLEPYCHAQACESPLRFATTARRDRGGRARAVGIGARRRCRPVSCRGAVVDVAGISGVHVERGVGLGGGPARGGVRPVQLALGTTRVGGGGPEARVEVVR